MSTLRERLILGFVTRALIAAEDNDCPEWDRPVEDVLTDLMTYDADLEKLNEAEVREALKRAMFNHNWVGNIK